MQSPDICRIQHEVDFHFNYFKLHILKLYITIGAIYYICKSKIGINCISELVLLFLTTVITTYNRKIIKIMNYFISFYQALGDEQNIL